LNEAKKAADDGHEVVFAYCSGVLSKCQVNTTGNRVICNLCQTNSNRILTQLPGSISFRPLSKNERRKTDIQLRNEFCFNTLDELKSIKYEEVEIGYSVLSFYISCTRNHSPEIDCQFKDFIYDVFEMTIDMIDQGRVLIDGMCFDQIHLFNGRQFQTRPWMDLAISRNITFLCNEVKFDFVHGGGWKIVNFVNKMPHDTKYAFDRSLFAWENSSLPLAERELLGRSFFDNRRAGIPAGDKVYTLGQNDNVLPSEFDIGKRNVTIFISSEDEFAALGNEFDSNRMFKSQLLGIEYILSLFMDELDFVFYVRIHPNLVGIKYSYHTDILKLEAEYKNVKIVPANSTISTYKLIDFSEKIIVFGSTTG
jgi:hypothetical protein